MSKSIYSKDQINLVKKLKKARLDLRLTQENIATRLGRTQSYVSKVESGQRQIDIVELKLFARIYRRKLEFFI